MLLAAAVTGVLVLPNPAEAHHSFAMFDKTQPVTVKGVVRKIEWTNPHVYFFMEAKDAKGVTSEYAIECGSINLLTRKGWKVNTIKVGDKIAAGIFPLRSGQPGGLLDSVTLPNGSVLKG
ncbi:MAG: DUF6152 family protein [Gammaproteobacteria bacterium]